jgi:hypothetical protein
VVKRQTVIHETIFNHYYIGEHFRDAGMMNCTRLIKVGFGRKLGPPHQVVVGIVGIHDSSALLKRGLRFMNGQQKNLSKFDLEANASITLHLSKL